MGTVDGVASGAALGADEADPDAAGLDEPVGGTAVADAKPEGVPQATSRTDATKSEIPRRGGSIGGIVAEIIGSCP